jgi:copper chaperone
MKSDMLKIGGMSCENCVGHVAKAIAGLTGTENVKVDLALGQAHFDYDPAVVTVDKIIAAVDDEGYSATLVAEHSI